MSAIEASDEDEEEYHPLRHVSPDFETLAREIQNRASCPVRVALTEKRHFRDFFGVPIHVVEILWELIEGLSPPRRWPPEAPALGPSFHEDVPQAEPGVFDRRRVCRRRRSKDPPKVGLAVHRRPRRPNGCCGE